MVCRRSRSVRMSRRVQIWKTLGLSQPSLQRRVGEDELERRLEAEQLLLLLHDQVVGALGVVAVGLVVLVGVGPAAFLVDREVAVVYLVRGAR